MSATSGVSGKLDVSLVIPCYNGERHLAQAIGSALEQTRPPSEIIVVDDGSTDRSREVARQFGGVVRLIEGDHGGACRARNIGAAAVRGGALMFLDADDVLGPTALEALERSLARTPGGIALCRWHRLEQDGRRWVQKPASCRPRHPGEDLLSAWLLGWYHPPCAVLWSRDAYERNGPWDEGIPGNPNDDGELMMRALARRIPVTISSQGAAYYRRPGTGQETLSGKRFGGEGLRARLEVFLKVVAILEFEGRLDGYREPVGQALDMLADDCADDHPALEAECRALARQYSGPSWKRSSRRALARTGARIRQVRGRVSDPLGALKRRRRSLAREVRYGLSSSRGDGRGGKTM